MAPTAEQIAAGHAVYTPRTLKMYDWLVLGLSNHFIWKCPTRGLLRWYDEHVTGNHLDVGVGTGYFLDRCRFPAESPRVALLDLNEQCLATAATRIARYAPEVYRANVLEPLRIDAAPFDSIGLNYVLHCLPGPLDEKAVALRHLSDLLSPNGVLFGSTILGRGVRRGWAARRLMSHYNRQGIFSNHDDDLESLRRVLEDSLRDSRVTVHGCVALFSGRRAG